VPAPNSMTMGRVTAASQVFCRFCCAAPIDPTPVAEHQHIRACQATAVRAGGWRVAQSALELIHIRLKAIGKPDVFAAKLEALQVVEGTVAFVDVCLVKARLLKLAIHIAGEDAEPIKHLGAPALQEFVAEMRHRLAVQRQAVAIEPPRTLGRRAKCRGRRDVVEVDLRVPQSRIGSPESVLAAKVRQPGVDAHARTGGNDQRVGLLDQTGRSLYRKGVDVAARVMHALLLSGLP